ncbi:outer membrane beta-barrel protein [[Muricauda] lutisoli]|uniref:Outer membrane beta-barrel protein n=1 Tax=[Muricauda] lutisoli TaxID=2816035 RepID=A0ABS3EXJ5_9FLAO|nr:outer membrane beta-barrel protein [[Muricauda] lutisoli]MBO0330974.1 outer membrane beta-barrel protein [[Muricauda] lutisoli]
MMGKKNLEQLFKERFKDFQEVPDEKVWSSIEASLDNKKQKKRAIPIWWGLGGIAAALVLLLLVFNPFTEQPVSEQMITDTDNVTVPQESSTSVEAESEDSNPAAITTGKQEGELANTSNGKSLESKNNQATVNKTDEDKALSVAENSSSISNKNGLRGENQTKNNRLTDAVPLSAEQNSSRNNTAIAMNTGEPQEKNSSERSEKGNKVSPEADEKEQAVKKSIYDAMEEQREEEEAVAESKSGKWSIGPSVAPVYFDASGDGSPVGPDFSSNSKSGKLNLSYGLTVAYEVGKKLKIRSGVHRVNYGYSTNDVLFSSTLRAASTDKIANIDYSPNSESIVVQSKDNAKNTPAVNSKEIALNNAPSLDGKMVQQLGYIEVPLELNYVLMDKKFGVDLIGGVSSLFLVDNAVLLESNDLVTEMGEANNINPLNFSANVGMGLNYKFSPKIRFNVEPVFKYQLNTFSNVSGDFRPYSIGVYSGFSFRF